MTRRIYFLLSLVFCCLSAGLLRAQATFVLTQAPCNANGILTVTVPATLTLPLTVEWHFYTGGMVVHNNVPTLSDALTGYAGQPLFVTIHGANNVVVDGGYQGAAPFNYQVSVAAGVCPAPSTATATVSGGTAPYTYQWSDAVTSTIVSTSNPATLPNGDYKVFITDANGCTYGSIYNPDSIHIQSQAPFNYNFSVTPANCTNGAIAVTAITGTGVPPYSYLWSTGATSSLLTNLTGGLYSVTVTDAQGCQRTKSEHVNQSVTITANPTVTPATCTQNDGSIITFGGGGVPPYSYLYSNGGTAQNQTGLSAGSYSVLVTDANGCTGTGNAYVGSSTPITATYTATASSCTSPTGSATLALSGGATPYSISWSTSPAQTGTTASNLAPGNYAFHVTDANGCVRTGVAVVPPVNVVTANITGVNATCLQSNGTINVMPSGGTTPYTYLWSNGATTANLTGLAPGGYTVQITDAAGCAINKSRTVSSSSPVHIGLASVPASCLYSADGSITSAVWGGATPYTYSWSNGQSAATATGLVQGYYSLHVTDANGCVANESTQLGYNAAGNSCYCTITGTVYNDANGNCTMDAGETGIPNIQIHCAGFGYTYTNASGVYTFKVPSGSYTLSETVLATYPLTTCQNNAIAVTAVAASGCTQTVNFANTVNPLHDVKISLFNNGAAVPGNNYAQICIVSNQGTTTENTILAGYKSDGQLNAATISPSGIFGNPSPNYYTTSGNTFPTLVPGASQTFNVSYFVPTNIPMNTSLLYRDSAVRAAPMSDWVNDYSPWNNVNVHTATVVSSYDPNFMQVNPKGQGDMGKITRQDSVLEYMVHFQNLGTYKAQNVVVIDTLDADLDWSSLRPIYSSHKASVSINEQGVLKYTFSNIELPAQMYNDAGSNGLFTFTIRQKPNLPMGTQIWNRAGIYFDYNDPVITNSVVNTLFEATSINEPGSKERLAFTIYPNPARQDFTIIVDNKTANAATSVAITDISGRTLASKEMHLQSGKQLITMNTASLTDGVYFVNLNIAGKKSTQKLVIVK